MAATKQMNIPSLMRLPFSFLPTYMTKRQNGYIRIFHSIFAVSGIQKVFRGEGWRKWRKERIFMLIPNPHHSYSLGNSEPLPSLPWYVAIEITPPDSIAPVPFSSGFLLNLAKETSSKDMRLSSEWGQDVDESRSPFHPQFWLNLKNPGPSLALLV